MLTISITDVKSRQRRSSTNDVVTGTPHVNDNVYVIEMRPRQMLSDMQLSFRCGHRRRRFQRCQKRRQDGCVNAPSGHIGKMALKKKKTYSH